MGYERSESSPAALLNSEGYTSFQTLCEPPDAFWKSNIVPSLSFFLKEIITILFCLCCLTPKHMPEEFNARTEAQFVINVARCDSGHKPRKVLKRVWQTHAREQVYPKLEAVMAKWSFHGQRQCTLAYQTLDTNNEGGLLPSCSPYGPPRGI